MILEIIFRSPWTFAGSLILLYLIVYGFSSFKPFHIHKYYLGDNKVDKSDAIKIAAELKRAEDYLKESEVTSNKMEPSPPIQVKEISINDSVWDLILNSF